MKTFGELRASLANSKVGWSLIGDFDDRETLPTFPLVESPPKPKRTKSATEADLRTYVLENGKCNPALLLRGVALSICSIDEAEELIRKTWGESFSLEDFQPKPE
jgi:hypothetical protein